MSSEHVPEVEMAFEMDITIRGDRMSASAPGSDWTEELANNLLLAPSTKRPRGEPTTIYGVGRYAAEGRATIREAAPGIPIPKGLAEAMESAIDVTPFPEGPLNPGVTNAALTYFANRAMKGVKGSRRAVLSWGFGGSVVFRLDYPGWSAVPVGDRMKLLRMLARDPLVGELHINGPLVLKRRPFRRTWIAVAP